MKPTEVIEKFDQYLYKNNLTFEAVIIGGAALSILGIISRQTQDVDVLDPEIPLDILEAAKLFAKEEGVAETSLKENWRNHGPESLRKFLRKNWRLRLQPLFKGHAITFTTLDRVDLIGTKILAYCDLNPDWPKYVKRQVDELAKRLGYVL